MVCNGLRTLKLQLISLFYCTMWPGLMTSTVVSDRECPSLSNKLRYVFLHYLCYPGDRQHLQTAAVKLTAISML